jgi:hypothetical protein
VVLTVGADVNAKDQARQTPLHAVADKQRNGKREIVTLLLTKFAITLERWAKENGAS